MERERELHRQIDARFRDPRDLRIESGRSKDRAHDRITHKLYHREVRDIHRHGGNVLGVRSGSEIQRSVSRQVAALGHRPTPEDKLQIAENESIGFVHGNILIPDVQLLVERKTGDRDICNLDGASQHYRRSTIAKKMAAGFKMNGAAHETPIFARRVQDGPDLVGSIVSR